MVAVMQTAVVARLPDWEARFNDVVAQFLAPKPYQLGVHDCFRMACAVVEALTGEDRWPSFSGYTTKREALLKVAQYGSSWEAAGDFFFGERIHINYARKGDIATYVDVMKEKHLTVVLGSELLALGKDGPATLPRRQATCVWRVG